jgi:hypothetical protein
MKATHSSLVTHRPGARGAGLVPFLVALVIGIIPASPATADDGNVFGSATAISPGTRSASLTSGDVDWFRFNVSTTGLVAIYSQGLTDVRAGLYDSAGTYLYISDNDNGHNYNFSIKRQLNPGTYYIKVEPGYSGAVIGNYTLTLRTQESAPWVAASTFNGNLSSGQIDFFRVRTTRTGLFEVYSTGLTDTRCEIYDSAGTYQYWSDDDNGANYNFHFSRAAFQPGEFLIVVQAGFSGALTGAYEGFVLHPDLAEAVSDGSYARTLSPLGDVDHFKFTVPVRGEVRVWTTGSTDTRAEIYDEVGVYQYISDNDSGAGYNFSMVRTLDPGDYYLRVLAGYSGNASGNYQLEIDLPTAYVPDPNDPINPNPDPDGAGGGGQPGPDQAAILKAALVRQMTTLKKQLQRTGSPTMKRKLQKRIAILARRIRAL